MISQLIYPWKIKVLLKKVMQINEGNYIESDIKKILIIKMEMDIIVIKYYGKILFSCFFPTISGKKISKY